MSEHKYAIRNAENPTEWWSNTFGWTIKQTRDTFTQEERDTLRLPMEGEWVEIDPNEGEFDDEFPDEHSHVPQEVDEDTLGLHFADEEGRHYYLQHKVTDEGVIVDVYDRYGEECQATWALTWEELGQWVQEEHPTPKFAMRQPALWHHELIGDWQYAVSNGDTLRGFSEWLQWEAE